MSNEDPMGSYNSGLMGVNDGSAMGYMGETDRKRLDQLTSASSTSNTSDNTGTGGIWAILIGFAAILFVIQVWIRGTMPLLWFWEFFITQPGLGTFGMAMLYLAIQLSIPIMAFRKDYLPTSLLVILSIPFLNFLCAAVAKLLATYTSFFAVVREAVREFILLPATTYPRLEYGLYSELADVSFALMPENIAGGGIVYVTLALIYFIIRLILIR